MVQQGYRLLMRFNLYKMQLEVRNLLGSDNGSTVSISTRCNQKSPPESRPISSNFVSISTRCNQKNVASVSRGARIQVSISTRCNQKPLNQELKIVLISTKNNISKNKNLRNCRQPQVLRFTLGDDDWSNAMNTSTLDEFPFSLQPNRG